ncbi:sensor histidine kinase [Paraflavitalea pollutisoli]|uniref:sensor histidine kinase n=1 Tax=Paraflavitalea pollutisoli TaxID=3034143 RepID=UPI0023EA8CA4|nr:histidine kinase [Paraflavitalea sp. H1-2-19X]
MYRVKTPTIVSHIIGWLIFLSLPFLFIAGHSGNDRALSTISTGWYWLLFGTYVCVFYLHTYVLYPLLYLKKKYAWYFSILLVMLASVYFLRPFDSLFFQLSGKDKWKEEFRRPGMEARERKWADSATWQGREGSGSQGFEPGTRSPSQDRAFKPPPNMGERGPMPGRGPRRRPFDVVSIFLFLLALSLGIALQSTWRWRMTEKRALQAEADRAQAVADKAQAELSFLKAQINPHFLFNTLNNIYSLAVTNSEHTAASIMKLSNILRYITDESAMDLVSLQDEIDCIRDFIALQQLRLGQKTVVSLNVEGPTETLSIPPLVLMTFVENAFKYGISSHHTSTIDITIKVDGRHIYFHCSNALFPRKQTERTGIGITNTQQRLEHLYPNRHSLNISTENNLFTVVLELDT